jgi:hypothetical protein
MTKTNRLSVFKNLNTTPLINQKFILKFIVTNKYSTDGPFMITNFIAKTVAEHPTLACVSASIVATTVVGFGIDRTLFNGRFFKKIIHANPPNNKQEIIKTPHFQKERTTVEEVIIDPGSAANIQIEFSQSDSREYLILTLSLANLYQRVYPNSKPNTDYLLQAYYRKMLDVNEVHI